MMKLPEAGDVVLADFRGARETKRRPAIVLSSALYHHHRPDMVLGLVTTRITEALAPTDYVLEDWLAGGLSRPSAFRSYIMTQAVMEIFARIGRLTDRDWRQVQERARRALELR